MKIRLGDILTAKDGKSYRVVECEANMVSLMSVNGYTLFSCHTTFIESQFGTAPVALTTYGS